MTTTNKNRFSKTPDLSAILNSDSAKDFISSGEAANKVEVKPTKPLAASNKKTKPTLSTDEMTWMTTEPSLRVQHIVRVPAPLKLLIEYLGDTGKGMNQTSISVAGMTAIAETLAKERGLPLPDSWGSWLTK
jgi:hypothetical protein